jgi:hypothetical protein
MSRPLRYQRLPLQSLITRIGELLDRFTPDECTNYFRAAGYADSF